MSAICVCGGTIRAEDGSPNAVTAAVQCHQRSPMHVAWRAGVPLQRLLGTDTPDGQGVLRHLAPAEEAAF